MKKALSILLLICMLCTVFTGIGFTLRSEEGEELVTGMEALAPVAEEPAEEPAEEAPVDEETPEEESALESGVDALVPVEDESAEEAEEATLEEEAPVEDGASGVTEVSTVEELRNAAQTIGGDIKLTADISITTAEATGTYKLNYPRSGRCYAGIYVTKNCTLDLNGHTLSVHDETCGLVGIFPLNCNMALKDSVGGGAVNVENSDKVALGAVARGGTFTLESGTINVVTTTGDSVGVFLFTSGAADIRGGSINVTSASAARGIWNYSDNNPVTIFGGTITVASTGGSSYGVDIKTNGSVTMSGGSITTTAPAGQECFDLAAGKGTIDISGFTGGTIGSIRVTEGSAKVKGDVSKFDKDASKITAGLFSDTVEKVNGVLADEYIAVAHEDVVYVSEIVGCSAIVDGVKISAEKLQDAIDAEYKSGTTAHEVKLTGEVPLTEALVIRKNVNLDLNSNVLNAHWDSASVTCVDVKSGAALTIKDNGENSHGYVAAIYEGSDNAASASVIVAEAGASVVIEGGIYDATNSCNDANRKTISGAGSFSVRNGIFTDDLVKDYLADKSTLTYDADEGAYIVSSATVTSEEELNSVCAGYVTLGADIGLTASYTIEEGQNITLDLNGYTLDGNQNGSVIVNNGILTVTDTSEAQTGTITGGTGKETSMGSFGGGIYNLGTLTVSGGSITSNTATYAGGGVYTGLSDAGICSFTMKGGKITGNTSDTYSAGVGTNEYGETELVGGEITNNTAASDGGGVYVWSDNHPVTIGGTVVISDNNGNSKTNNLWIATGSTVVVSSDYTGSVGVTMQTVGAFTGALGEEPQGGFTSDNAACGIRYDAATQSVQVAACVEKPAVKASEASVTETSVTLPSGEGWEYSMDGGETWQDSNVFKSLKASTKYTFCIRVKATATAFASEMVTIEVTTAAKAVSPKTGDENNIALWLCLLTLCGAATVVVSKKRKEN